MSTIPVYIQTPQVDSSFFADWPLDDLDNVIPLIARWGVTDCDGERVDENDSFGEFVVEAKRVTFRVNMGLGA